MKLPNNLISVALIALGTKALEVKKLEFAFQNLSVSEGVMLLGHAEMKLDGNVEVFIPDFVHWYRIQEDKCQNSHDECQLERDDRGGDNGGSGGGGDGGSQTQSVQPSGTVSQNGQQATGTPLYPRDGTVDLTKGSWKPIHEISYTFWFAFGQALEYFRVSSSFEIECYAGTGRATNVTAFTFWPSSKDSMTDFLGVPFGIHDPTKQVIVKKNQLSAAFVFSEFDGPSRSRQVRLEDAEIGIKNGSCSLHTGSKLIRTVGTTDDYLAQQEFTTIPIAPPPQCDYPKFAQLVKDFRDSIKKAEASTSAQEIYSIENRIYLLYASSAFRGCGALLDQSLVQGKTDITLSNRDCQYEHGTLDFAVDPCCNKTVGFTTCCAPRTFTKKVDTLVSIRPDFIARTCDVNAKNVMTILATLDAYISSTIANNDEATGCDAITRQQMGSSTRDWGSLWKTKGDPIFNCFNDVFEDKTCTADSDCLTETCALQQDNSNKCVRPNNPSKYLIKCFLSRMGTDVKRGIMRSWAMSDASDEALFRSNFINRTTIDQCTGMTGYAYNGGWYKPAEFVWVCNHQGCQQVANPAGAPTPTGTDAVTGKPTYGLDAYTMVRNHTYWGCYDERDRSGCFYLPPSREHCVAETQCNWYRWDLWNADCNTDYLDNQGFMCGNCFGGNHCQDVSVKGGCALNLPGEWFDHVNRGASEVADLDTKCTAAGGKLWTRPQGSHTPSKCYSTTINDKATCDALCQSDDGPKPAVPKVCISTTMSRTECDNFPATQNYQKWAWNSWADGKTVCQANAWDETSCTDDYGSLGFSWVPRVTGAAAVAAELEWQCKSARCIAKDVTRDNCWQIPNFWFDNALNNGNGYCSSDRVSKTQCEGAGYTYYAGYEWLQPQFDTEARCNAGICSVPRKPFLAPTECESTTFCTRHCPKCVKSPWAIWADDKVCYHTNQTLCQEHSTSYTTTWMNVTSDYSTSSAVCAYQGTTGYEVCSKVIGASTLSCSDLGDRTCWEHPFGQFMSCHYDYQPCGDAQTCLEAGYCEDWDVPTAYTDENSNYVMTEGACVLPAERDYGWPDCHQYYEDGGNSQIYHSPMGCMFPTISEAECPANGGFYVKKATQMSECGVVKGCCERNSTVSGGCQNWELTMKNATECSKCGGTVQPFHKWNGGQFVKGAISDLNWARRENVQINNWERVVDHHLVGPVVGNAMGFVVAEIMTQNIRCKTGPLLTAMTRFACACGTNVGVNCATVGGGLETTLDTGSLPCGTSTTSSNVMTFVNIPEFAVLNCSANSFFEVGNFVSVPGGTGVSGSTKKRSSVSLGKRATIDASCYVLIQNSNDAYVGQVLGDCTTFSPSSQVSGVEICMNTKSTIPHDTASFPTYGIATKSVNNANNDEYKAITNTPYFSNDQLCVQVNSAGTYCPAAFRSDWLTVSSAAQPECSSASDVLSSINAASAALLAGATKMSITSQPASTVASGSYFAPAITVQFEDDNGNLVSEAAATVTMIIVSGTGTFGASVVGVARVAAVNGVATFDQLSVDLVGTGYQLVASAFSLASAPSTAFDVTPGDPAAVAFSQQPGGCVINIDWIQPPIVQVVDEYGNHVPNAASVTVTLFASDTSEIALPSTANVKAADASSGSAEFSGLRLTQTYENVYMTAAATGLVPATSITFNIIEPNGDPCFLRFSLQPSGASVASIFIQEPIIEVVDYNNNTVSTSVKVFMEIKKSTGTNGATLSGQSEVTSVGHVAQYTDLTIDRAGTGYVLTAKANGLVMTHSNEFIVNGAYAISFTTQPASAVAESESFSAVVSVYGVDNQVMTSSSEVILLTIKPLTGTPNAVLQGIVSVAAVNGVATFNQISIDTAGAGYQLYATTRSGVLAAESEQFNVGGSSESNSDSDAAPDNLVMIIGIIVGAVVLIGVGVGLFFCMRVKSVSDKFQKGGN